MCNGFKEVEFAANGELFIANLDYNSVTVFSADGFSRSRGWGTQGGADGQLLHPVALATVDYRLCVLDRDAPHVQVFE